MAQDVNINIKVKGGDKVKGDIKQTTEDLDGLKGAASGAFGQLDALLGGIPSKLQAGIKGLGGMTKGFKSMKVAIASTGIGLLVIALGSLAAAFSSSEEGQNKFNKLMGIIGSVTDNFVDLLADLGEKLIAAFENPQKAISDFAGLIKDNIVNRFEGLVELVPKLGQAIGLLFEGKFGEAGKVAADAVGKVALGMESVTDSVAGAVEAAQDFAAELEADAAGAAKVADMRAKADKVERDLLVARAKQEAEIAELKLRSRQEDEFTAEERKAALVEAQALEDDLLAKEVEFLQLRADAQVLENTFARSNKENLDKEAEALAAVEQVTTRRLTAQRATQRELTRVNREIERNAEAERKAAEATEKAEQKKRDARAKSEQDIADALSKREEKDLSQDEKELLELENFYNAQLDKAVQFGFDITAIEEQREQEMTTLLAKQSKRREAISKAESDKRIADEEKVAAAKEQIVMSSFSTFMALSDAFAKGDERGQRRAFKRNKAASIAQAIASTYLGAQKAYTSQLSLDPTSPVRAAIAAGIAVAGGLANIAQIKKTKFQGAGGGGDEDAGGGATGGNPFSAGGGGTPSLGNLSNVASLAPSAIGGGAPGQPGEPVRAYVVSQEISDTQALNTQLELQSTL